MQVIFRPLELLQAAFLLLLAAVAALVAVNLGADGSMTRYVFGYVLVGAGVGLLWRGV